MSSGSGYLWGAVAVLIWSTSASVVGYLEGHASYFQIVVIMQGAALVLLIAFSLNDYSTLVKDISAVQSRGLMFPFLWQLLLFASFITIYHLAFFYSLHNAPRIQANIINYLWPLLLFLSASTIFNVSEERIGMHELSLVFLAFTGAFAIAWDPTAELAGISLNKGLAVALLAAFAGAAHVNMSVVVRRNYFSQTYHVYLFALALSFPMLLLAGLVQKEQYSIGLVSWTWIVYLGAASLVLAHVCWTKALDAGPTLGVSNLAYLVPVLSTIFLVLFLGDQPSSKVIFGATLIVIANILSNEAFRRIHAESGALITFFFASFVIFFKEEIGLESWFSGSIVYLGEIFAIISGFFLARMWQKNKDEQETLIRFATEFEYFVSKTMPKYADSEEWTNWLRKQIDNVLRAVSDFDVCEHQAERALKAEAVRAQLEILLAHVEEDQSRQPGHATAFEHSSPVSMRSLLNIWIVQKLDKASSGEVVIVSLLGIVGAMMVIATSGGTVLMDVVSLVFIACIAYIVFKIRDFNSMATVSNLSRLMIVQAPLKRLGLSYYIPDKKILYSRLRPTGLGKSIRYWSDDGALIEADDPSGSQRLSLDDYQRSQKVLALILLVGIATVIVLMLEKYN